MESSKKIPIASSRCLDLSVIPNSWDINQKKKGSKDIREQWKKGNEQRELFEALGLNVDRTVTMKS